MSSREVGRISGIFRYPVKSMLGEALDASALGRDGIPGDRAWGVRDEGRGDFYTGKRSAALMSCRAAYAGPAQTFREGEVPEIRLPDGSRFAADATDAAARLGEVVGREVTLWPVVPAAREARPSEDVDLLEEMEALMARTGDEPRPDFSSPSPELLEVYARGGPFFDAFPISLMSQRAIDSVSAAAPDSRIDVRRFRPNLLVETSEPGRFPEQAWIGHRLRIGEAVLAIRSTIVRCVMTTHGFADLPKDPGIMRTLVAKADGNLGVYATLEEPGEVRCGDALALID